jgi:ArsR family transcriptional regulator, nickel/cobalt-responsive transcriptional repressor
MPHPVEHTSAARPLDEDEARELAATLRAIGSPARLYLMTELLSAGRTVEELATAAGLSLSGTSHNLRILRDLKLVRGRREGRHVRYELYDQHVAELLAAIRHHREHVYPPPALERPRARAREAA